MTGPNTGLAESQPSEWRETFECAIRERVPDLVESILEEELEEAAGAKRSERRLGERHPVGRQPEVLHSRELLRGPVW